MPRGIYNDWREEKRKEEEEEEEGRKEGETPPGTVPEDTNLSGVIVILLSYRCKLATK